MDKVLQTQLPLKLDVTQNSRLHWAKKARKVTKQKHDVFYTMKKFGKPPAPPLTIVMTRIGTQRLDDDNATASCKHARDAIAQWLGIDDGDERLEWKCEQQKGAYGLKIEIYA